MAGNVSIPFLWPLAAAASASQIAAQFFAECAHLLAGDAGDPVRDPARDPGFASPNRVRLELPTMRLREFGGADRPTLVCAPYALHAAHIADFAPGHSLVGALLAAGGRQIAVTDWRSATTEMQHFGIDQYLADLNVAVDEFAGPVDLVGLCQGGWLALVYAARFPAKVRRLVLVGAPVDVAAGDSGLTRLVAKVPLASFRDLVRLGGGRICGDRVLSQWGPPLTPEDARRVLQMPPDADGPTAAALMQRFADWYAWTVDLPGAYYLQVVEWIFKQNRIVSGEFAALGRCIDLGRVRTPLFLVAARDDELVSPDQIFAVRHHVATAASDIVTRTVPCGHLGLFLGAGTLRDTWREVAEWLDREAAATRH